MAGYFCVVKMFACYWYTGISSVDASLKYCYLSRRQEVVLHHDCDVDATALYIALAFSQILPPSNTTI